MTSAFKFKSSVLGVAWLCAIGDSSAMTLGRARSIALLGQPLELSIPVQFDPEERPSGFCFDADVYFGENKLDSSQITVTTQWMESQSAAQVRVVSRQFIDEPVVTVYLRAGCLQKTTRKYVMLSDLATEMAASVAPANVLVRTPALPASVSIATFDSANPTAPITQVVELSRQKTAKATPSRPASNLVEASETPVRSPNMTNPANLRRPRLKLAPLDMSQERDPVLKLSADMFLAPSEDLTKRSQAAALWKSLNASAQDILRDEARIHSLESDLQSQKDVTAKNGQSLHDLSTRLEQVEAQKYANPLVYALMFLLVFCGVSLAYVANRLRSKVVGSSPWWRGGGSKEDAFNTEESGFLPPVRTIDSVKSEASTTSRKDRTSVAASDVVDRSVLEVDIDIDLNLGESVFASAGRVPVPPVVESGTTDLQPVSVDVPLHRDFSQSAMDGLRSTNMQEMLDVRQQAEFFMTLGQYDEAIGLLTGSIKDSGESSPLVYLELLKALHSLSRKSEYDRYRRDFNARFSGRIPEYSGFSGGGADLEEYPEVLLKISSSWPSHAALDVIESCLVYSPERDSKLGFDLNAYRDLLTLHGVASRILSTSESGPAPFSTTKIEFPQVDSGHPAFLTDDFLPESTQSVQALPGLALDAHECAVDLDLSDGASNLIEFDAKGLSGATPLTERTL